MIFLSNINTNWESYLEYGERKFFKKGDYLYKQGTRGEGFYYVCSGAIKIITSTIKGKERVVNIVVPGELAGVHSMDQKNHFTTAVAFNDSVLYFFSQERFNELMKTHPELVNILTESLIKKMRILIEEINFNSLSAEQQMILLLSNLCNDFTENEIPLTQQELVKFTGLNRITIYKILKKWKDEGALEIKNHKFYILNSEYFKKNQYIVDL